MSGYPTLNEVTLDESDNTGTSGTITKKASLYGWDGSDKVRVKVDSNGAIATSPEGASCGTDTTTITTAGTAVQLPNHACKRCFIQSYEGNAGTIAVGDSNVVAAAASLRGKALYPTQGDWFYVNNTNLLYVDSTANGDKVSIYYEN